MQYILMLFILPFHPPKPPEAPRHNIYLPIHILLIFLKKKNCINHWVLKLHIYAWGWSHPMEHGKSTRNQTPEGNWLFLAWQPLLFLAPQPRLGTCLPTPNCHVEKTLRSPSPPQSLGLTILLPLFCKVPRLWVEGCHGDVPFMANTSQTFILCTLSSSASLY